jgi:uncharacterized protein (DUF2141 family)
MKKLIVITALLSWLAVCAAQEKADLTVTINKLESKQGQLLIAVFDRPDGFPEAGAKAFRSRKTVIDSQSVTVYFRDLPPGIYAVCFVHDTNLNEKLDKNMGIPAEKYGVSNNIKMGFGPPKFEEAKFYLGRKDTTIFITPAF